MTLLLLLACAPETPTKAALPFAPVEGDELTTDAEAAVARMPAWLAPDLRLALVQQDDERQDVLAATILDVDDPALLDEVGFAMAHLSKEVLKADKFYPELLVENAALIYEVDPSLDYVEIVETGEAGVDADWSTSLRYQVEEDGVVSSIDLDPELYYWFVVHPRIEDEHPWYIDAWDECTRATLECSATPETGTFWRRFLWDEAAASCPDGESCPIVSDYLPGAATLYGDADGDDAVHRVAGMLLDSPDGERWFNFGAYGERSIQPNRIYALGRGNCGEWADMTSAVSRTALIPNVNVTPSSWDHTWNGFWLGNQDRWVAWEPVNWWFDYAYGSGYATYATRGDASVWYQTEQYTSNVATLEVTVVDAADQPVDGATVALWSAYEDSWWYAGELVTGQDGVASFPVGADLAFAWLVSGELGGGSSLDGSTDGVAAGETERVTVALAGEMPGVPSPGAAGALGDLAVNVSLTTEGRRMGVSYRLEDTSTQPAEAPALQTWLLSWDDYAAFEAGEDFSAADALDPAAGGVVVIANLGTLGTAAVGEVTIATSGGGRTEGSYTAPVALLPGAWMAVAIGG